MSPKLPRVTAAALVRALRRAGWTIDHQTGSHLFLGHRKRSGLVVVPMHSQRTLRLKTLASILDQAGLTAGELQELL